MVCKNPIILIYKIDNVERPITSVSPQAHFSTQKDIVLTFPDPLQIPTGTELQCVHQESFINQDVGNVNFPGDYSYELGTFSVDASGSGYADMDEFFFIYKKGTGFGELFAEVESIQETNEWAVAGVMIRDNLDPSSTFFMSGVSSNFGLMSFRRKKLNTTANFIASPGPSMSYFVKISRENYTYLYCNSTCESITKPHLVSYKSQDGYTWEEIAALDIPITSTEYYFGLVVTSFDNSKVTNAVFDNVGYSGFGHHFNAELIDPNTVVCKNVGDSHISTLNLALQLKGSQLQLSKNAKYYILSKFNDNL